MTDLHYTVSHLARLHSVGIIDVYEHGFLSNDPLN